jgi:hypothetical protein
MSDTSTKTVFLTQSRVASPGRTDPWNDTCNGHDDFYAAVACLETTRNAIDGKDKTPNGRRFFDFVKFGLSQYGADARMELRIVRRTITTVDEVVDGVGAEMPNADVQTRGENR